MGGLTPLRMPLALPLWGLAGLKTTRGELRLLLGPPHFVETDPRRTCGGEADGWAYALPTGQRVLVLFDASFPGAEVWAEICGDPPELDPILGALGIPPDDQRLVRYQEPLPL